MILHNDEERLRFFDLIFYLIGLFVIWILIDAIFGVGAIVDSINDLFFSIILILFYVYFIVFHICMLVYMWKESKWDWFFPSFIFGNIVSFFYYVLRRRKKLLKNVKNKPKNIWDWFKE